MLTVWLVYCALASAATTLSQRIQYQLSPGIEQPVWLDDSELIENPLFSLHKNLVNIESITGNEQAAGEYLEAYLTFHNFTVERQYLDPLPSSLHICRAEELREQKQRFNLLAYPGEHRQTPVLLSSVSTLSEPPSLSSYHLVNLRICNKSKGPVVLLSSSCNISRDSNLVVKWQY